MTRPTVQEALGVAPSLPIREMSIPWKFLLRPSDCENATPFSPAHCPLARAITRETGYPALVLSEVAYVVLQDAEGAAYVGKFSVPHSARRALQKFDRTGKWDADPEAIYELTPLYKSKTKAERNFEREFVNWRRAVGGAPKKRSPLTAKPHIRLLEKP